MATTITTAPTRTTATRQQHWLTGIVNSYFFRKLIKAIFSVFVVTTLIFFLVRLLPGNPIDQFVNELIVTQGLPREEAYNRAASLFAINLDEPVYLQYVRYLSNLLRGNMGNSITSPGTSVSAIILHFLPWTLFSVGTGLVISYTIGVLLGLLMAFRRNTIIDHLLTILASIFSSVPGNILGILLVVWLGVQWKVLPIAQMRGAMSPGMHPALSWAFVKDVFFHGALPIATYVLATIGGWMLGMKSSTISTLGEDYVTVARARGLRDWRITTAYVGRNAALPLFTQLAIAIGFAVGGSILIESIFQYQGIGGQLLSSISKRDYTVMQGIFLVTTLSVVFANLFADLLYSWLDPRIKVGRQD